LACFSQSSPRITLRCTVSICEWHLVQVEAMFLRLIDEAGSVCGKIECAVWHVAQVGATAKSLLQQRLAVNALGVVSEDIVLGNLAIARNRSSFTMALAADERHFQRRHRGALIFHGKDVVVAVASHAVRRERIAAGNRLPVERFGVERLLAAWQVPHFTGAGLSCGKSFPSRSAWQPVQPKLACTEVANFFPSTYSETVLPPRVVVVLLSPWQARHSAPGWSAARTGRSEKRRETTVARSIATATPRTDFATSFALVSLVSHVQLRQYLLHARSVRTLGFSSPDRQQVVARGTIVGDGLAVLAGVTAVVATEAARRIVVPEIIRVRAPGQTHVGENVAQVDIRHFLARLLDQSAPRLIDLRVICAIEIVEFFLDAAAAPRRGRSNLP
jgi:hypothetical protein